MKTKQQIRNLDEAKELPLREKSMSDANRAFEAAMKPLFAKRDQAPMFLSSWDEKSQTYFGLTTQLCWEIWQAARQPAPPQHPDDLAVDRFAAAMKKKLAQKREEGRGGWEDRKQCSRLDLALALRDHLEKGDPVDVANFAMFLWARGESTR